MSDNITRAIVGIGTLGLSEALVYQPMRQQQKAQERALNAQQRAEMDARRIAASKKPMEESATLGMDTGGQISALGSLGLLIEPDKAKKPKGLGTSGSTGLSTIGTTAGLGFN